MYKILRLGYFSRRNPLEIEGWQNDDIKGIAPVFGFA